MNTVQYVRLSYPESLFSVSDIPRIRAYLSRIYPGYTPMHNHLPDGRFRYSYPEIQFKMIQNQLNIIGISHGADMLLQIFQQVDEVEISYRLRQIHQKKIQVYQAPIGMADEFFNYTFLSPWMALNQKNYNELKNLPFPEWRPKLERILWGNLRALAHAFDIWLDRQDEIAVNGTFKIREVKFKGKSLFAFTGHFSTNFHIPPLLGIGKQVARGFGVVDRKEKSSKRVRQYEN